MKRYATVVLAALIALTLLCSAPAPAEGLRIAFVDMVAFAQKSKRHQAARKQLMKFQAQKEAELKKLQQELEQLKSDLQRQGPLLQEDAQTARVKEISVKEVELRLAQQQAKKQLQNRAQDADELLRQDLSKVIGEIRKKLKLDFVLNSAALFSAANKYDITDRVVQAYDNAKGAPKR